MWLGVAVGNLLWVLSSLVMSLWTLWFGIGLARLSAAGAVADVPIPAATT